MVFFRNINLATKTFFTLERQLKASQSSSFKSTTYRSDLLTLEDRGHKDRNGFSALIQ